MIQPNPEVWKPSAGRQQRSILFRFLRHINQKFGLDLQDYPSLHAWSIRQTGEFWGELADFCKLHWQAQPSKSYEPPPAGKMRGASWFPGSKLNFAENLLTSDGPENTIIAAAEGTDLLVLSRSELRRQVEAVARGLKAAGVQSGDRVAGVVSNTPEAIVAMLGAAAIGAVWSSCSPDFGARGILDRFSQIEPTVLFATKRYQYNGKIFDLEQTLQQVEAGLPSLKQSIRIDHLDRGGNQHQWSQWMGPYLREPEEAFSYAALPFDHPLYIMFSSGTTGVPKCIVHGAGGTLLQHKKELMLHCDLQPGDRLTYYTTCGWMMWNWMVSAIAVGATLTLYEGSPTYPSIASLWQFLEQHQVNFFGTSPKFLQATAKADFTPRTACNLDALRGILSTGSPLLPEQFDWVHQEVKSDVHLSSISGGTDIISCFMLGNPLQPVRRGEIQAPGLGMAIAAWNDSCEPVLGEKGELVCTVPFPSMPLYFWKDQDGSLYDSAYFNHYQNLDREIWRHGDFIALTATGGVMVFGRSDATLNPGGVRIGTAEIYRQVERLPEIQDSICAAKMEDGDAVIALFVQLIAGCRWNEDLNQKIRQHIKSQLTPRHVPRYIVPVQGIPYTRSGKKVEVAVTRAINGEPVANASAISNPEHLEEYVKWGKSRG